MTISDEMVAAMHTYLAALHTDSGADLDDSDRQFLALLALSIRLIDLRGHETYGADEKRRADRLDLASWAAGRRAAARADVEVVSGCPGPQLAATTPAWFGAAAAGQP